MIFRRLAQEASQRSFCAAFGRKSVREFYRVAIHALTVPYSLRSVLESARRKVRFCGRFTVLSEICRLDEEDSQEM